MAPKPANMNIYRRKHENCGSGGRTKGRAVMAGALVWLTVVFVAPVRAADGGGGSSQSSASVGAALSTNSEISNAGGGAPQPQVATNSTSDDYAPTPEAQIRQRWLLSGLILILLGIGAVYRSRKRTRETHRDRADS
jgi:hypothetical protein